MKMDWVERINKALAYIDDNLTGEICYDEISRLTLAPVSLFQRFFILAAGVTLSEYIRRRKLTCALADLQKLNAGVTETAFRYGYESSNAFYIAFKRLYGVSPSQAKKSGVALKQYDRIYFTLTVSYIKGENDMVLLNVDKFHYTEPLYEAARIVMNCLGADFTPEYIQGISGAAFIISGGCPSRPTCANDLWTTDFIRSLGYEIEEYPCFDENGNDITEKMIEAVKKHIDEGMPALVFHAFSAAEFDVVCGYDEQTKHFIGRSSVRGNNEEYAREPWDRAKTCEVCPAFGAVLIKNKNVDFDKKQAEINSLVKAVQHGRQKLASDANPFEANGIEFYYKWADEYANKGKERGVADAYCYDVYSSVRKAAIIYLRGLADNYGASNPDARDKLHYAAASFEKEVAELEKAYPYLSWESPWGVDEDRSRNLVPVLRAAAGHYEKAIGYLEQALEAINAAEIAQGR